MKLRALDFLVCPACTSDLNLAADSWEGSEVLEGRLSCRQCEFRYPIRAGVPRFVPDGAYASRFVYQRKAFREVQLDSRNGTAQSADRLDGVVGWAQEKYRGRLVLDAGVGAGRFAEVVAARGGE